MIPLCLLVLSLMMLVPPTPTLADEVPPPRHFTEVLKAPYQPQVLRYQSKVYGDLQQFGFCATDFAATPKPLIVDLIPGTYHRVRRAARDCASICRIAKDAGLSCVAVRPCGLGNGSVFQGFGEVDVYDVIESVMQVVAIDPDRITVTGASMGGAATWYHASHYPGVWAGAAPFCGYCDYQLWKKPGGTTFHRSPWEEFSWRSRGASYRVQNMRHVPTRIIHGEWDRSVGGGVDVVHSRSMDRKLSELGFAHEYHEIPETGHGCRTDETFPPTVRWLLKQSKVRNPDQVSLVVHTLRHNKSGWVAVEQQAHSGDVSRVDAERVPGKKLVDVETANVGRLRLGPLAEGGLYELHLDETVLQKIDFSSHHAFLKRTDGSWSRADDELPKTQKHPGLSGPLGDIFLAPVLMVYGTGGDASARHHNATMANDMAGFFRRWNGGVHRGGINGDNEVRIPTLTDQQVLTLEQGKIESIRWDDDEDRIQVDARLLHRANLLLIGDSNSNAVTAKLAEQLPLSIGKESLILGGKEYPGSSQACLAVFSHPDRTGYVAVLAGQTPDAICGASHVGLQLVPDFLVFDQEHIIDWGFLDNHWQQTEVLFGNTGTASD